MFYALLTPVCFTTLFLLKVLMKIRNELAYARLDLERAVKSNFGVRISHSISDCIIITLCNIVNPTD